jgi:hypothetical protein
MHSMVGGLRSVQAVLARAALLAKWLGVAAFELSTVQSFVSDLCDLLGVPRPHTTSEPMVYVLVGSVAWVWP